MITLLLIYSGTCLNKLVEWSIASADFRSSCTTHQKVWPVVTILDPARVITWQSSEEPEKLWWHHMPRTWELWKPFKGSTSTAICNLRESKMNWLKSMWGIMLVTFVIHYWFHVTFFFFSEEERSQFASSCFLLIIAVPEKCVSRKCFWVSLNGHSVNLHVIAISPSEQLGKKHAELKEGNVDTVQYCVPHTWALYVGYYHFKWFCFSQRSGHWFTYDKGDKDNKEEEEEF